MGSWKGLRLFELPASPPPSIPLRLFGKARASYFPLQDAQNPQQIAPQRQQSTPRWCGLSPWTVEIITLVISLSGIAAMFVVLRLYGGKPLPRWPLDIGLNTAISTMALVSKTSLLAVTGSCIGQLKWTRLRSREHELIDLDLFDAASKGPSGSLRMIISPSLWQVATLGAILTVAATAFEPFTQQAITYPLRNVSVSTATIPRTQSYRNYAPGGIQALKDATLTMKAAAYNGLFNPDVTQLRASIPAQCSTGNCTFPPYSSLAICSKCVNVTHLVVPKGCTKSETGTQCESYLLPNDLQLYGNQDLMNTSTVLNGDTLDAYGSTLYNLSVLVSKTSFESPSDMIAYDCSIYFCLQKYRAVFNRGSLQESVGDDFNPDIPNAYDSVGDINFTAPSSFVNANESSVFTINPYSFMAVGTYISRLLTGTASGDIGEASYSSDAINALYNSFASGTGPSIIEALAISMTIDVRTNPAAASNLPVATGTAWANATFVHVRWSWLLLPLALEALGFVFLCLAIILSLRSNTPAWKSSLLAALFLGRPDSISGKHQEHPVGAAINPATYPGEYTLDEMKEKAKKVRVKLSKDDEDRLRLI